MYNKWQLRFTWLILHERLLHHIFLQLSQMGFVIYKRTQCLQDLYLQGKRHNVIFLENL